MSEVDKKIAKQFKFETLQCYDDLHKIYTGTIATREFAIALEPIFSGTALLPSTARHLSDSKPRARTATQSSIDDSSINKANDIAIEKYKDTSSSSSV
ncbi:hypothetical protein HK096_010660, partial [Nowakowskiella sp. JEL0078]